MEELLLLVVLFQVINALIALAVFPMITAADSIQCITGIVITIVLLLSDIYYLRVILIPKVVNYFKGDKKNV